jgi:hypothetical protein
LADLLMQLRDHLLAVLRGRVASLEQLVHPFPQRRFPLTDQQGMHLVLTCNLRRRFHPDQRLQANLGLESTTILFAFSLHRSALSHIEQTSKSLT